MKLGERIAGLGNEIVQQQQQMTSRRQTMMRRRRAERKTREELVTENIAKEEKIITIMHTKRE